MKKLMNEESFRKIEIPVMLSASENTDDFYIQFHSIQENREINRIISYYEEKHTFEYIADGTNPKISPDGKRLSFLQKKETASMLVIRDMRDGKEKEFGPFCSPNDISWSPDGRRLVFTAALQQNMEPADLPGLQYVRWIDRTKFKTDGVGIYDGSYRQVYFADVITGKAEAVSEGKRDYSSPVFIKNDTVAYLGIPENPDNSDDYWLYIWDLERKNLQMHPGPGGPMGFLSVSHDHKKIAFIGHNNEFWEATNYHIYILDLERNQCSCLTSGYDRSIGNYVINDIGYDRTQYSLIWDKEDQKLIAWITDGYTTNLYQVSLGSREIVNITKDDAVYFAAARRKNGVTAVRSDEITAAEIIVTDTDGQNRKSIWKSCISNENYELSRGKEFSYTGMDFKKRKAFFYPSIGALKGAVLNIHGGPHYCHGFDFSFDIQLLAANGFGTIICNPAGSQGNGEELSKASYHDWGGKDYKELMNCVDSAIEAFHLETVPLMVMGGSYGGFMTNWMISHTNRFRCAISERSTCNRYSQAGTSDCAFRYGMFEFDGHAWENPEHYMEHSPISYVKNVQTPVLLIHGDQDMNCPISQSEEWYSALKLEGKEAYLAIFPGQSHSLTGKGMPDCRRERYRLIIWWAKRFCIGRHSK